MEGRAPADVATRIAERRERLTPAERRVASVVLDDPQVVAFGTVAGLAERAGTSPATVVRFAGKLGLDGFVGLQAGIQEELARQLRPAAERIRQRPPSDVLGRSLDVELENVHRTLEAVDRRSFAAAVARLADRRHRVGVLAAEASHGIAAQVAADLGLVRPGVTLLSGSEVRVDRLLADFDQGDTVLAVDLRRYERWVLATARRAADRGVGIVAVTDSSLSPLADLGGPTFVAAAASAGPFDSHVGILALANALVAAVAARLRVSATRRLDRVEAAWRESGSLVDG
ncbi:MAG TPA: MurR/RpiR family transcriptional regulator [Acidimicrobiales bacterium]|jgi:DNA-binding MurR/RpiR family transcriptional regulator